MQERIIEIGVGVFVAAALAALFVLAMKVSNINAFNVGEGYTVTARFDNIGGLKPKAPITIGGVRIGRVASIDYDDEYYEAVVKLRIANEYQRIPKDTTASVYTAGLLGEQYIGMEPGGAEAFLQPGDELEFTQSAMILEQVISRFLFSQASEGAGGAAEPGL